MQETGPDKSQSERRIAARYRVEEQAQINILDSGATLACSVHNLSEGGCLLESVQPVGARIVGKLVEVSFQVNGMGMRFHGTVIWQEERVFGLRFAPCLARRKDHLLDAIEELRAELERDAKRRAAEEAAAQVADQPAQDPVKEELVAEAAESLPDTAQPPTRERRQYRRHNVDSHVKLYLIKSGIEMRGLILDVSQGGCRIATDERFPLGIYTRSEIEFTVDGLPFRLPGVVQAIHSRHCIGIRLIDLSPRKQGQLQELIDELDEKLLKENAVTAARLDALPVPGC